MTSKLFQPFNLAGLELPNRIVMAPLTRNRASPEDDAPTQIHCEYYAQRATAGLIISEGVQISAEGKGYFRTPGLYSAVQQKAWRRVTDAVHSAGGRMFAQLWHVGRIAHRSLQPDRQQPVAPSAITADAKTFTADGLARCSEPRNPARAERGNIANARKPSVTASTVQESPMARTCMAGGAQP